MSAVNNQTIINILLIMQIKNLNSSVIKTTEFSIKNLKRIDNEFFETYKFLGQHSTVDVPRTFNMKYFNTNINSLERGITVLKESITSLKILNQPTDFIEKIVETRENALAFYKDQAEKADLAIKNLWKREMIKLISSSDTIQAKD